MCIDCMHIFLSDKCDISIVNVYYFDINLFAIKGIAKY